MAATPGRPSSSDAGDTVDQVDPATTTAGSPRLVDLDRATFAPALGRRAVQFRHALADDPRFDPAVLGPMAASLPAAWIRANEAQYDPHEARGICELAPDADLDAAVRTLATSKASIRAYNLELTSEFRVVAGAFDGEVRALVGSDEGGLITVNLGAFVASPDAVTPAHPDRHHNLLLQVSGRKEVWVEDDPDALAHHRRTVAYFCAPQLGAPELPPARSFVLEPGDGVYIPPFAYHWTRVLDGRPAMGLSVGFNTPATVRAGQVNDWDVRLHRRGVHSRPSRPGGARERMKAQLMAATIAASRARKKYEPKLPWYRRPDQEAIR
jgi:hypothetical protein